jgi:hypothetical protein
MGRGRIEVICRVVVAMVVAPPCAGRDVVRVGGLPVEPAGFGEWPGEAGL